MQSGLVEMVCPCNLVVMSLVSYPNWFLFVAGDEVVDDGGHRPVMDLHEFLTAAELDQYYDQFRNELKVTNVSQIKYVEEPDLTNIGMTKPEIRRLRQIYKKSHSHGAFGKLKKVWENETEFICYYFNISFYTPF